MRTLKRSFPKAQLEKWKTKNIIDSLIGTSYSNSGKEYLEQVIKCVSLVKGHLVDSAEKIDEIIDKYGIDTGFERDKFITLVQKTLDVARNQTGIFDFDDMIWMPLTLNLPITQYDRVFIDEAQDLNHSQIELSMRSVKPDGRVCAVGDERQALYGFRGADSEAIPNIIKRLEARVLPLSVTYRCARSIVREANKIVPDIQAAENAVEGKVSYVSYDVMKRDARPGDFILSRINAPLIGLTMGFLKEGRPANIQGRDIGQNLSGMIRKSKANSVKGFIDYICKWKVEEIERLQKKQRDTTSAEDRADCLLTLCEDAVTLDEVNRNIERLFVDTKDSDRIIMSTVHRAKGAERDTVWMLNNTFRHGKGVEESNIIYVCATRARFNLNIVQK